MKRPSLLRRLLIAQSAVIALSCGVLLVAGMLAAASLLRGSQDQDLQEEAAQLCHGIAAEQTEHSVSPAQAALDFFEENASARTRFEALDAHGAVIASWGKAPGWPVPAEGFPSYGCASRATDGWLQGRRACGAACSDTLAVRVVAADVLGERGVRRAAAGLLLALPFAVGCGWILAYALLARAFGPLRALETAASRLRPTRGVMTLGVNAPTAELHALESSFNGLLGRLGEALASERRFTREASHELRTPLTALRGQVERLAARLPGTPAASEAAGLLEPLASLDRLIEALLLLARSDVAAVPHTRVNLCDVVREIAGAAGAPYPEITAPDEILVTGSEELLERASANLLENARRYAGPTARVRVEVSRRDGECVMTVEDSGPGIPEPLRERVFEPFFRGPGAAASHEPGAGLGLAVVRAIVNRHGGSIAAGESPLGGTRMTMRIPVETAAAARA